MGGISGRLSMMALAGGVQGGLHPPWLVVGGWWLVVGDFVAARCDPVFRHRMGDCQQRRDVFSPNHQNPTTNHWLAQPAT
jgi:hypothetical protein